MSGKLGKALLTSPSGKLGSRILQHILDQDLVPTARLVLSTTSPEKVYNLAKQNDIAVVHGDFRSREELLRSWSAYKDKIDVLFLVSYPDASIDPRVQAHRDAIDAARAIGVRCIVYTSLVYGGLEGLRSKADVMQAHLQTVQYLEEVRTKHGIDHVVLRMGIYAESWSMYAGFLPSNLSDFPAKQITESVVPADGKVAWVSIDDLAEAGAHVLAEIINGRQPSWTNTSLCLTGSKAYTIAEVCKMASKVSGKQISSSIVGEQKARGYHLPRAEARGIPEWLVENWLTWHQALADGECAFVDSLVENLLGRPARTLEDLSKELFSI